MEDYRIGPVADDCFDLFYIAENITPDPPASPAGNILKIKKTRSKLRLQAFQCSKHLPNFIYFYPER